MTTKTCPDCGATIDADARVCPRCKGRQRMKIGVVGKLVIGLIVLIVVAVALYFGGSMFAPNGS